MSTRQELERIAEMLAELAHDLKALLVRYPVAGERHVACELCGQALSPDADRGAICGRCESTLIRDTRGSPSPQQFEHLQKLAVKWAASGTPGKKILTALLTECASRGWEIGSRDCYWIARGALDEFRPVLPGED